MGELPKGTIGHPTREREEMKPEIQEAICQNLALPMPLSLAAEAAGVHRNTAYNWIEKYPDFADKVTFAKAQGAKKLVELSLAGGKGSNQALWHLERRYRDEYAPVKEHSDPTELKIIVEGGLPRRSSKPE